MARPACGRCTCANRIIAAELREAGIDVNCAPLADVARDVTHPVLRNRLYGEDPQTVAAVARAVADGLSDGGVVPVLKHLPGYGLGVVDSHEDLPRVGAPLEDLDAVDFGAFRPLADLPLGMTAHIVYDAIDPEAPATLSPAAIRLIREEIGFTGLLMTDDLSMGAFARVDRGTRGAGHRGGLRPDPALQRQARRDGGRAGRGGYAEPGRAGAGGRRR